MTSAPRVTAEVVTDGLETMGGDILALPLTVSVTYPFGHEDKALRSIQAAYANVVEQIRSTRRPDQETRP